MKSRSLFLLALMLLLRTGAELQTRIYHFEALEPAEVEAMIRPLVPMGPRVLVNPEIRQVMVIADEETHEQVSRLFERLDRPSHRVQFWFRHNQHASQSLDLMDGDFANFPVTRSPLPQVADHARARLPPEWREAPLVGSVLRTHFSVLRADPARVRIRITPSVLFGSSPPYEVVSFSEMSTDLMMTDEEFVDLVQQLSGNEFYRMFFRSEVSSGRHVPVGLLVSLDAVVSER